MSASCSCKFSSTVDEYTKHRNFKASYRRVISVKMVEDRRASNHDHTPCCTRSQFVQNQTAVFILHKNLLHYEFLKPSAVEIFPRENFFLHFHRVPGKVETFLSNLWLASKFHSRHGNT